MTPQENIPLDFILKRDPKFILRGLFRGQSFWDRRRNAYAHDAVAGWSYVSEPKKATEAYPFGLTGREVKVVEAIVQHHVMKLVARALCISDRTLEGLVRRARVKMGATNTIHMALLWDRWARSQEAA